MCFCVSNFYHDWRQVELPTLHSTKIFILAALSSVANHNQTRRCWNRRDAIPHRDIFATTHATNVRPDRVPPCNRELNPARAMLLSETPLSMSM